MPHDALGLPSPRPLGVRVAEADDAHCRGARLAGSPFAPRVNAAVGDRQRPQPRQPLLQLQHGQVAAGVGGVDVGVNSRAPELERT